MNAYERYPHDDTPLFGPMTNPVSHTGDPSTSREAALAHIQNGRREKHARIVLELVLSCPGLTAVELYHQADESEQAELKEIQEVRRRLTDLLSAGLVRQGGQRTCAIKRTTQVTWIPTRGA